MRAGSKMGNRRTNDWSQSKPVREENGFETNNMAMLNSRAPIEPRPPRGGSKNYEEAYPRGQPLPKYTAGSAANNPL